MKGLLKELHHRPIAYYPIYRKITGSTTAGILLSQLMYWWAKMDGEKFYKTDAEIIEETELTEDELRSAKSKIKQLGFIRITREGMPAVTNYEIDAEKLAECVSNSPNKIGEIPQTGLGEFPKLYNIVQENTTKNPLTPTSGGTDDQPTNTTSKQKEKANKNGAVSLTPAREDFAGFANPDMAMEIWAEWREYKKEQHRFTYKSKKSEALAIRELLGHSGGSIQKARAIIHHSMAQGYKGLFAYEDKMAASAIVPNHKIPEDTYQLPEEMQRRYEASTKKFYEECHLCAGIRWLSNKEYEKVVSKDPDFIGAMWYTKIPNNTFNTVVWDSLSELNKLPRWEKEKWKSVYEWLKKDVSDRVFGRK